jgi:hypothetical protein
MMDRLDFEGQDREVSSWLRLVDPASADPNYWLRFQSWVMVNAGPELARRRLMGDITIGDVLTAWSRTLVPAAVLAATLAGLFMARGSTSPDPAPAAVAVEELLVAGIEDETIPVALENDDVPTAVAFAGERF